MTTRVCYRKLYNSNVAGNPSLFARKCYCLLSKYPGEQLPHYWSIENRKTQHKNLKENAIFRCIFYASNKAVKKAVQLTPIKWRLRSKHPRKGERQSRAEHCKCCKAGKPAEKSVWNCSNCKKDEKVGVAMANRFIEISKPQTNSSKKGRKQKILHENVRLLQCKALCAI